MIRTFFLGMIGLIALVLIARQFPAVPGSGGAARTEAQDLAAGPFARLDGMWEGAVVTYLPDGTPISSEPARRRCESVSPVLQEIVFSQRHGDGTTSTLKGRSLQQPGALRRELAEGSGAPVLYTGTRAGLAVIWHRLDVAAGIEETIREEVIRTAQGDLYTLDGTGSYDHGRRHVILEGRFRRPDSETDLTRWDRPRP